VARVKTNRLAGGAEIATRLGVTRQRADQLSPQRDFPEPYDELGDLKRPTRIWLMKDVEAWIGANRP
jgi:hypothetical protein